ncbi:MAG: AMP-binding protein [Solirubrobacterales bacterium]
MRVAYLDKNGPSSFEVLFGTAKGNAVHVPVNWRLSPNEIATILNDAGVRVLFVGTEFAGVLERFEAALTSVSRIVMVGRAHDRHPDLEAWLSGRPAHDPGVLASADDLAMLLYTSGTTGRPKGAMLTNRSLAGLRALADRLGCDDRTVSLVAMPMFHIGGGGWALVALDRGGTDVVLREVEPARIVEVIERHRVTQAFLVPTVIGMVLAEVDGRQVDFSSLTTLAYGASPISETVLRRSLHAFGCGFVQLYGLTETTGGIVMLAPEDHDPSRPGLLQSCGRPMPGVEVRVVDPETGEDLPDGLVGELWVRSGQNMVGYWEREAETRQTLTPDAWLRTGDAGYRDDDGYLFLHDRIKDMILSGGENVYPAEVENVLMAHPSVADVAVIGVPHEVWGGGHGAGGLDARRRRDRGRADRLRPRAARRLQVPQVRRLRGGAAAQRVGQAAQARAARPLPRRRRSSGLSRAGAGAGQSARLRRSPRRRAAGRSASPRAPSRRAPRRCARRAPQEAG